MGDWNRLKDFRDISTKCNIRPLYDSGWKNCKNSVFETDGEIRTRQNIRWHQVIRINSVRCTNVLMALRLLFKSSYISEIYSEVFAGENK